MSRAIAGIAAFVALASLVSLASLASLAPLASLAAAAPAADAADKVSAGSRVRSEFDRLFEESVLINGARQITYDQFQKLRSSDAKFVLVDVLSADDYGTGHIPQAVSLPVHSITLYTAANKIPMGSNVVVYCLDFNCPYSEEASRKLTGYGYRVLAYKGGIDEWQQKGQKLVR